MQNLDIYKKVAAVPKEAQKTIAAGRTKGFTDINPMWRIKTLTEQFGVCGIGWKYTITKREIIEGADGVQCAFVDIDLFVKVDGEWSDAIPGTGGSSFISVERGGKYTNDECFKMALTDAISVACKALGIGADVYWQGGRTKYDVQSEPTNQQKPKGAPPKESNELTYREKVIILGKERGIPMAELAKDYGLTGATTEERYKAVLKDMEGN